MEGYGVFLCWPCERMRDVMEGRKDGLLPPSLFLRVCRAVQNFQLQKKVTRIIILRIIGIFRGVEDSMASYSTMGEKLDGKEGRMAGGPREKGLERMHRPPWRS